MAAMDGGWWQIGFIFRIGLLLFILVLLYGGLKRLTFWGWSGYYSTEQYNRAHQRYQATLDEFYVCRSCGNKRTGREFYFDVGGPDGHRLDRCMVCTRDRAEFNRNETTGDI